MSNDPTPSTEVLHRYEGLRTILAETTGALIAFSGGVDSTLLLHAAREVLQDRVMAATISTPYIPRWEIAEAKEFAKSLSVHHAVLDIPFPEELRMNPPEHCYICKRILFTRLLNEAKRRGLPAVFDGTNVDDLSDYRPGLQALRELGIRSPLLEAGLSKQDIRELSRQFGLPTWNKPSFACLLSRMEVNRRVKEADFARVEQAERLLMNNGFPAVRVRHHGDTARIEVPRDRIPELVAASMKHGFDTALRKLGYRHVSVDLSGYVMGSQNPGPAGKQDS
jgi:uncharacterized protein